MDGKAVEGSKTECTACGRPVSDSPHDFLYNPEALNKVSRKRPAHVGGCAQQTQP